MFCSSTDTKSIIDAFYLSNHALQNKVFIFIFAFFVKYKRGRSNQKEEAAYLTQETTSGFHSYYTKSTNPFSQVLQK